MDKGIAKGDVKIAIKASVSVCLRLSTFARVRLRLLSFSPLRLLAFVSVCQRLSAFVCVCLRLLAFAHPPLLRPPLRDTEWMSALDALQHWLFCNADVILTKSCAAASEKLQH